LVRLQDALATQHHLREHPTDAEAANKLSTFTKEIANEPGLLNFLHFPAQAVALMRAKRFAEALPFFEHYARVVKTRAPPEVWRGLSECYVALDRPDDARNAIHRLLWQDPRDVPAWELLDALALRANDLPARFGTQNALHHLKYGGLAYHQFMAQAYGNWGALGLEAKHLQAVVRISPDEPYAARRLVEVLAVRGELGHALKIQNRWCQRRPAEPHLWTFLGYLYHKQLDFENAATAYLRARDLLEAPERDLDLICRLALIGLYLRRHDLAEPLFAAHNYDPGDPQAQVMLHILEHVAFQLQNFSVFLQTVEKIGLGGHSVPEGLRIVRHFLTTDRVMEARFYFDHAFAQTQGAPDPQFLLTKSEISARFGDFRGGLDALDGLPPHIPGVARNRALLEMNLGIPPDEGAALLRRAATQAPLDPVIWSELAHFYRNKGETARATFCQNNVEILQSPTPPDQTEHLSNSLEEFHRLSPEDWSEYQHLRAANIRRSLFFIEARRAQEEETSLEGFRTKWISAKTQLQSTLCEDIIRRATDCVESFGDTPQTRAYIMALLTQIGDLRVTPRDVSTAIARVKQVREIPASLGKMLLEIIATSRRQHAFTRIRP
jgi:predicted Zn-dependent protease